MDCDRIGEQFPCVLYSVILQRKFILVINSYNKNFGEKFSWISTIHEIFLTVNYFRTTVVGIDKETMASAFGKTIL